MEVYQMAPEDNDFGDEEYFSKKKKDKYFFKNEDDYFNGEDKNQPGYSRYEENKKKYPRDDSIDGEGYEENMDKNRKRIPDDDPTDDDYYDENREKNRKRISDDDLLNDEGRYSRGRQENGKKRFDYEKDESGYDEGEEYNSTARKYKERISGDFFKDEDFDYTENEDVPSGEDPDDYSTRTKKVKQKRRKRKIITSSILIFFLVAAVAAGAFFGYKFIKNKLLNNATQTETTAAQSIEVPTNLQLNENVNIVISGALENLLEPDINFIFYSRFDSKINKLSTLTIPINTLMDIPGFGLESANKSVEFGGMDLLILTLKKALGMDINKYIIFNMKDITDKLGGITVNLDQAVSIKNYTDDSVIELKQGENKLNGVSVVSYLKYFSGSQKDVPVAKTSDQKKIFDSLFLQIAGASDADLEKNLNSIKNLYETNLTGTEIYQFISTVSKLKSENNVVYPLDVTSVELEGGNVFYVPDISKLNQFFNIETTETTVTAQAFKGTVDLQVLNGVGTPGIAGQVGALFKDLKYDDGTAKFNLLQAKDADNYNYTDTQIVVNSKEAGYMAIAEEIKNILKTGSITQNAEAATQNIVIIVGSDFGKESGTTETTQIAGSPTKINVLNGVGVAGLAKKAKEQLESSLNADSKLIEVIETKDASNFNYTQTEILFFENTDEMNSLAQQIQKALGAGVIKYSENNPDKVGISVILGKDYTAK
jgi:LCP family protein required for cell wall assembly